jgi:hypothetical protein
MIAAEKYKQAWFQECEYGSGRSVGIKVLIAGADVENKEIQRAAREAVDTLEHLIECQRWANDPDVQLRKETQRQELLALFQGRDIYVEEIENGYSTRDPWYSQFPWFKVTTNKGVITLGWRKRVVSIDWTGPTLRSCKQMFPTEDVTKFDGPDEHSGSIHAWSLEKAQEYITRILA